MYFRVLDQFATVFLYMTNQSVFRTVMRNFPVWTFPCVCLYQKRILFPFLAASLFRGRAFLFSLLLMNLMHGCIPWLLQKERRDKVWSPFNSWWSSGYCLYILEKRRRWLMLLQLGSSDLGSFFAQSIS